MLPIVSDKTSVSIDGGCRLVRGNLLALIRERLPGCLPSMMLSARLKLAIRLNRKSQNARVIAAALYRYHTVVLVDSSPLIYLAKLEALDVFEFSGQTPLVTQEVERETARPGLGYEHPDALVIADALRSGLLKRTVLTGAEQEAAARVLDEAGGIDQGEAEILAAAAQRGQVVLLFERRATRLARSMGIEAWTPVRLLFAGTHDAALLRRRTRAFGALVQMRYDDIERLIQMTEEPQR